jgi:hypothetical protein
MSTPLTTVFRLSPRATWQQALAREQSQDHYRVRGSEAVPQGGMSCLQRFKPEIIQGRKLIPLLAHTAAYPLARGGQFAAYTSRVWWWDLATGALAASSAYAGTALPWHQLDGALGPWDWWVNDPNDLTLSLEPITVDFAQTEYYWRSAWAECRRAQALDGGTGQGTAYGRGEFYSSGNQLLERRISLRTCGRPGIVGYTIESRISDQATAQVASESTVCFWVHTSQYHIQEVELTQSPVVSVDPDTREHSWVNQAQTWHRLG